MHTAAIHLMMFFALAGLVPCYSWNLFTHHCWTKWLDRDNPSGTGDWELLSLHQKESQVCKNPVGIQCQTTSGQPFQKTGETLTQRCVLNKGLVCENKRQRDRYCQDYRVRYLCPCHPIKYCWTQWLDRDNPSGTGDWELLRQFPKSQVCPNPRAIQCQTTSGVPYQKTGEKLTQRCVRNVGLVCENKKQSDRYCQDYRVRFLCPCKDQ